MSAIWQSLPAFPTTDYFEADFQGRKLPVFRCANGQPAMILDGMLCSLGDVSRKASALSDMSLKSDYEQLSSQLLGHFVPADGKLSLTEGDLSFVSDLETGLIR